MKRRLHVILPIALLLVAVFTTLTAVAASVANGETRGGVGMQVVPIATGDLVVLKVLDGSPASRAGVLPGDVIRSVNGNSLRGSKFEDVARKWLWGEAGKVVEIALQRPGATGLLRLKLKRVPIAGEETVVAEIKMLEPEKTTGKNVQ